MTNNNTFLLLCLFTTDLRGCSHIVILNVSSNVKNKFFDLYNFIFYSVDSCGFFALDGHVILTFIKMRWFIFLSVVQSRNIYFTNFNDNLHTNVSYDWKCYSPIFCRYIFKFQDGGHFSDVVFFIR